VYEVFANDSRLNPTHISLYMALFQCWNRNYFNEEFHIYRDEIMLLSKIGSKTTYYRCLKDLNRWKYIIYQPSHSLFTGCLIKMTIFWTGAGPALVNSCPTFGTGGGPAVVPYIKHIQTIENIKTDRKQKNSKISFSKNLQKKEPENPRVPNPDNLRTREQKNYNEPL
jgi:hypothetical protein